MVSIVFRLVVCEAHGSGRSSAISRSKRRNVMATRKNFIEKEASRPYGVKSTFVWACFF